jgi:hypothetical protein
MDKKNNKVYCQDCEHRIEMFFGENKCNVKLKKQFVFNDPSKCENKRDYCLTCEEGNPNGDCKKFTPKREIVKIPLICFIFPKLTKYMVKQKGK